MMETKRVYNKKRKLIDIQEAASRLFMTKPYASITVDDIALQAGLTKRTLYKYYPSKLTLFVRMFDDYLRELSAEMTDGVEQSKGAEETVRKMFDIQFDFIKRNIRFMLLFWTLDSGEFGGELPPELIQSIHFWNKSLLKTAVGVLKEGQKQGLIGDHDPEVLVNMLSAFLKGIFLHTQKQTIWGITDLDPALLKEMFWTLIKPQLFK
ncbi:MAG: TetR/AcrR family transcriptional regulator [Pseudomonadota bacterium]